MANETSEGGKTREGAASCPQRELPDRIARLINPTVRAERAAVVAARMSNSATRVHQRRCAELIANHLLETFAHD